MSYLVNLDQNGMAVSLNKCKCEGVQQVLYIQCRWDWRYVVEWQCREWAW